MCERPGMCCALLTDTVLSDGNAWSARFQRLLSAGSLIFKTTIFRESQSSYSRPTPPSCVDREKHRSWHVH
jgi:predicted nucleic acid-binding Zn ribbon protein